MTSKSILAAVCLLVLVSMSACSKKGGTTQPSMQPGSTEVFNSGTFSSSSQVKVYVHTFPNAGTFGYHCIVHGTPMSGVITVAAGQAESSFVSITDNVFGAPSPAQIRPGAYIKWIANGGLHGVVNN